MLELTRDEMTLLLFAAGILIFSASFLFGMKCSERIVELRRNGTIYNQRDRWFWLSVLCACGVFIGAFLMLIWPRIGWGGL